MEPTKEIAAKVAELCGMGLAYGVGRPIPGEMCVEAAVCFAQGQPHGDEPACVHAVVRRFKIRLNDSRWSSNEARGNGMRKLAVAQLGSDVIDGERFADIVVDGAIRKIVPIALRAAGKLNPKLQAQFEANAVRCEQEGSQEACLAAYKTAVVTAAATVTAAAAAAVTAAATTNAASAATNAAAAAAAVKRDEVLFLMAEIGLDALKQCGSPGCQWLYLCE